MAQWRSGNGTDDEVNRNLSKMLTYMDAFARFRTLNTLSQIETLLQPYSQLEDFEKAQLGAYIIGTSA